MERKQTLDGWVSTKIDKTWGTPWVLYISLPVEKVWATKHWHHERLGFWYCFAHIVSNWVINTRNAQRPLTSVGNLWALMTLPFVLQKAIISVPASGELLEELFATPSAILDASGRIRSWYCFDLSMPQPYKVSKEWNKISHMSVFVPILFTYESIVGYYAAGADLFSTALLISINGK